ncbi:sugar nucleotide-binding protein [Candidatus Pelagibacter ubique]|nr:sugar nucleotide-binding protein [Candidatus Pelagibacter ubique]
MKIIILGANGFLGSALSNQLQKTSHTVLPFVRKKKKTNAIECDVGNVSNLLSSLNEYQPEVIINCAAKVDFSENSAEEQYSINALVPAILASWCSNNNTHLIQISSSVVNGNTTKQFSINSIELPTNHYGRTKLLADQSIRLSKCSYTIIRFGGIFGEGGADHLGINNVINQAKKGIIPHIVGEGNALRNYIHVQDAAKAIIYCLVNKIRGTHYSGNHQTISIAQMINNICSIYLKDSKPEYKNGGESIDQITIVSDSLPKTLSFKKSLQDYL